eukprot:1205724-Amorphochlora_amoeboformis.AAC.1
MSVLRNPTLQFLGFSGRTFPGNYSRKSGHPRPQQAPNRTATMTTVMIDNYDSFTYNVYQYLSELGAKVVVARNDKITVGDIKKLNPVNIVISPGTQAFSTPFYSPSPALLIDI